MPCVDLATLAPEKLVGLLHLSSGLGVFSTLLLGFRALSEKNQVKKKTFVDDTKEGWHHREKLEIVEILSETHDIKTFRFRRKEGKSFPAFVSGQFLSFQIGENEKCLRSYSISTSVTNRELLQVSIKKIPEGLGSGWFHDRKVGDEIWVFPPSGLFTDAKLKEEPRVYVAGGIGITPLLSMIATNLDRARRFPMFLFYGARSTKDLAFHGLLKLLAERYPHFKYVPVLPEKADGWTGQVGRVSAELISRELGSTTGAHYFFCGPPPMTNAIIDELVRNGTSMDRIHSEKFASPQSFDPAKVPHRESKLTYRGKRLDYQGKQTILEFLETKGDAPAFSCRVGVCGTCKVKVKGKVETLTDSGLTPVERREGYALTCVAYPLEDLELG